jgi:aminodeoxyfutalosine deaminase
MLVLASVMAAKYDVPLAMHLAESIEEIELLATGLGPFREFLEELHVWRDDAIPRGTAPIDYLMAMADARRVLIVHGNYLDDEAICFLAENRHRFAVVYCPRTHAYFKHAPYPLQQLSAAGVVMCVGTDSRASNPDLSLFEELRFIVENHPQIAPEEVLRFGTFNGAQMLGDPLEFGTLRPGAYANLAIIALPQRTTPDPHELLFAAESHVAQTWWRGKLEFRL